MGDQVEGMFGIIVIKDRNADPVQQAGHMQIRPAAGAQMVEVLKIVEQLQGQPVHLLYVE
ncbi:hypothetical protein D3C75_791230 [compost metagenome]